MGWVSPKVYAILSSSEEGKDILEGIAEKSQDEVDKEVDAFFGNSGKGASKGADYQKAKKEDKQEYDEMAWWDKPDDDDIENYYADDDVDRINVKWEDKNGHGSKYSISSIKDLKERIEHTDLDKANDFNFTISLYNDKGDLIEEKKFSGAKDMKKYIDNRENKNKPDGKDDNQSIDYKNIEYPKGTSKGYTMVVNKKYEQALPILEKAGIKLSDFGGKANEFGGFDDNSREIMDKYVFEPFDKKYPKGNNEAWEKDFQPLYDAIESVFDKNYNDWYIKNQKK